MKIRAVIFDVYGTLLEVGPPPADADARWEKLFREFFQAAPAFTRLDFAIACQRSMATRHATARGRGIAFPEILWPEVVAEVLPGFAPWPASAQEEFVFRLLQTSHTTRLFEGAADALRQFTLAGCVLGIASNAQAYTLRELREALRPASLHLDLFAGDLCFWSFEHGFSKPDPQVFRVLSTRLPARGITAHETLMVGDRLDNDIGPARAQGWQTWQLAPTPVESGGDWPLLAQRRSETTLGPPASRS